jgi:adenine/guanine phosphoribosyltransferase-like PRPP-binding protein
LTESTKECQILVSSLKDKKIDKVIGVESRGFFFGMLIAQELNGFRARQKTQQAALRHHFSFL